jgi:hypothetical protein
MGACPVLPAPRVGVGAASDVGGCTAAAADAGCCTCCELLLGPAASGGWLVGKGSREGACGCTPCPAGEGRAAGGGVLAGAWLGLTTMCRVCGVVGSTFCNTLTHPRHLVYTP